MVTLNSDFCSSCYEFNVSIDMSFMLFVSAFSII